MRKLLLGIVVATVAGLCSQAVEAGTYTATGTVVNMAGQPRANWTVAVSYKYQPGIIPFWWTVHVQTDANGNFTCSRDFTTPPCTAIRVQAAQGNGAEQLVSSPGTYDFG